MNNNEKRELVRQRLSDPVWATKSDRAIARELDVSQPFVGSVRRSLSGESVEKRQDLTTSYRRGSEDSDADNETRAMLTKANSSPASRDTDNQAPEGAGPVNKGRHPAGPDDGDNAAGLRVRAIQLGYYGNVLRREGDVFTLLDARHFSERWMARAGAPERSA
jgi:hypothetical protein